MSLKLEDAFGEGLKKLRQEIGLSQNALAERCGCNVMSISKLERGLTQPSLYFFLQLAQGLEVDPEDLLHATMSNEPEVSIPAVS